MNSHPSGNVFEKNVLAMHKFCVITNMLFFCFLTIITSNNLLAELIPTGIK